MKEQEQSYRYFPIALFSSVMGFAAVTIIARQMENTYNFNHVISTGLLFITTLWFLVNASFLLARFFKYREDVIKDFNHPLNMNFFAAISISLLLLANSFIHFSQGLSFVIWLFGAIIQLSLTIIFLHKLIWNEAFQIDQFTPVSFIPIVGNLVVPIAGSFHVHAHINWFFFSVGALFSIIYLAFIFNRLFFASSLPGMLVPTLFIILAPPSVGYVAYVNIMDEVNVFAFALYGFAFLIALLLFMQLRRIFRGPIGVPAWALLFPSGAFTIATMNMYRATGMIFYEWISIILVLWIVYVVVFLSWKTIGLYKKGMLLAAGK